MSINEPLHQIGDVFRLRADIMDERSIRGEEPADIILSSAIIVVREAFDLKGLKHLAGTLANYSRIK